MAVWGRVCDAFGQGGPHFWARFDFEAQTLPKTVTDLARYARGDGPFSRPHRHLPTNKNAPHGCEAFGAENETRTRDPDLGKVVLYQLSYFRSISKTRSRGTGLQRYGKNLNLQIFLQFFRFLDFAALRSE